MPNDPDFVLDDLALDQVIGEFPRLFEDEDLAPLLSMFADEGDELLPPGAEFLGREMSR
jgi:hypothetical protein